MFYYFLFLALLSARKVLDQRRSERNICALERTRQILPCRDRAMPWLMVTHVAFFVLTPVEVVLMHRRFVPVLGISMMIMFLMATLLRQWATALLGSQWNSRVVVPQDLDPVMTGPYRLIRHPNYLAMSLELLSAGLMYSAFISTAIFSLLNLYAVVRRIRSEEEVLFQLPAYRRGMARKARLIPGIY